MEPWSCEGSDETSGVYLDMCSLKRPFDDQRHPRVREEATARVGDALRTLVVAPRAVAWRSDS